MFDIAKAAKDLQQFLGSRRGHGDEGFGCAWSPHTNGQLTTCANDGTICGWDDAAKGVTTCTPRGESAVADVQYSPKDPYDLCRRRRQGVGVLGFRAQTRNYARWNAHDGDINALAYPTSARTTSSDYCRPRPTER